MKTSNFTNAGTFPGAVAISQGVPRGWAGPRYLALAPSWRLIHKGRQFGEQWYTERYRSEVLDRLDPRQVWEDLQARVAPYEPVLLCWEAPGQFCHRRLVAEWLAAALGEEVAEL